MFLAEARARRLIKNLSKRTIDDYTEAADWLKTAFDKTHPMDPVRDPSLISKYRDARPDEAGRGRTRANRELSFSPRSTPG
jgi:hypothetical protein